MKRTALGLGMIVATLALWACGESEEARVARVKAEQRPVGHGLGPGDTASSSTLPLASPGEIHIGVAAPMTGGSAAFGTMIKKACELKVKQVNAAGGVKGMKVILHSEDDKGEPTEAINVARKLVSDPRILLVIGHFNSACSIAAKEEYNRAKIVQFTPASTNVNVCKDSDYTYRNIYRDDFQGIFVANYVRKILGYERVAVFYDNDDYGKGLMQSFGKEAAKLGLQLVAEPIAYNRDKTQDFKVLLNSVRGSNPQIVFVAGLYNEAALIAKAARDDLKMAFELIGGDGVMENTFITTAGQAAEGAYVVSPFLFNTGNDSPKAKALVEDFQKEYGHDPDTWSALTYDAVSQSLLAIEQAGPDRAAIKKWFDDCNSPEKGYDGVTGNTYFNPEGDCFPKLTFVATVKGGKFVPAAKQLDPKDLSS